MSTGPEPVADLVAVACVVEASLLLASEWSRVLIEYVYPLLKRLNELHPSHQFRLAFVTYGAADTRPLPLLSKRFFAPLSHVTKELREEPSKLGIGQTNSGSGRGLSALEGLVAAIELFDILMMSANNHAPAQSPQKESRSLISHLFHIAASPPDNAQRPFCNTLQHLDFVNWDSIPAELKKRKINLSLISLRKIPQFQDLQSLVAGPGGQPPWFNVRAPHTLLLAGFPAPQKTGVKRQTDAPVSDQSPDTKRQKVAADPISKTSSASPALSHARTPQSQHPQQLVSSQAPQPPATTVSGQNLSPTQSVQPANSIPDSTPATVIPSVPLPPSGPSLIHSEILDQVVAPTGLKFGQMMERLKVLEKDITTMESQIPSARNKGQVTILGGLQNDLAQKVHLREQIKRLLKQHYQKMLIAKEALNTQAGNIGSALSSGLVDAGSSTQSHPPSASSTPSERLIGSTMEEHKPALSDSQVVAQFWQSRGGTISAPSSSNPQAGSAQTQLRPTVSPEVAAQMQKPTEKKVIQSQSLGPSSQISGPTSREASTNPNVPSIQASWQGTLSWTPPRVSGPAANEMQIHVIGFAIQPLPGDIRTDTWPKNLPLHLCKEPLKDGTELQSWVKRHKPHLMRFASNPRAPDKLANDQKFQILIKFMFEHHVYAYAGWSLPSGKFSYNIVIFPMGSSFVGAIFSDGVPDLPRSGNTLDVQPPVEEVKPQLLNGPNLPSALIARMQGLDPVRQRQIYAHFVRVQAQQGRQQLQQTQRTPTTSNQTLNSLGIPIPPNSHGTVANIPTSLPTNVNGLANTGVYNTGVGTVNHEMMQSFMQRSAEATSQGMNPG